MKHRIAIILFLSGVVASLLIFDDPAIYLSVIGILVFLFSLAVLIGVTTMKWNYFLSSVNKMPPGKIMFTFDDGPAENTLKILEILKKHQAKATFFVIGKQCEKQPEILKQIANDGHIIGNHSFSHENRLGWASTKTIIREIEKTNTVIQNITGQKPIYYRPPFGVTNPNIARAIRKTGMMSVGWNIRTFDTVIKDPKELIQKVTPRLNKKGNIVLMHDTCEQSVEALDVFLQTCQEKGIEIVNLSGKH